MDGLVLVSLSFSSLHVPTVQQSQQSPCIKLSSKQWKAVPNTDGNLEEPLQDGTQEDFSYRSI